MAEPRFKKDMEGGNKPPSDPLKMWEKEITEKKTKYLRLGYTSTPRTKKPEPDKKGTKTGRRGGKKKATAAQNAEAKETRNHCCSDHGEGCCCGEE